MTGELTRNDLTVGQEVRVFSDYHRRKHGTDGAPAWVTKVGRTLVTITTNDDWVNQDYDVEAVQYRIDDQVENGRYAGAPTSFRTLDQVAVMRRERAAWAVIKDHGLERPIGRRSNLTVDQLETIARVCDPSFAPVGTVILVDCGQKKITVIKELRAFVSYPGTVERLGLKDAKNLADSVEQHDGGVPVTVAPSQIVPFVDALRAAGATVEVR